MMFALKVPFCPFIGSSKRKLLHYLTNFSIPSGNLFQELQTTLSQRLNMLLNAVIVMGMKEYCMLLYWEGKSSKKLMCARLKSELLIFKVSLIYFVYLLPILFSSPPPPKHHILSRMCKRSFTTVIKDSLKIIHLKMLD